MTQEERILAVAEALEFNYGLSERGFSSESISGLAKDAIKAADATREATDAACKAFIDDAFALVAGKDRDKVKFHVRRALEAALKVIE